MHGQHSFFPGGPPPPPHLNPNFFLPNPNFLFPPNHSNIFPFQNPNNIFPFQNPNNIFPFQNPNNIFPFQNPNSLPNTQPQLNPNSLPNTQPQLNPNSLPNTQPQLNHNLNPHSKPSIETIDNAVAKARTDIVAACGHVAAWEVSQSVLKGLNVESWDDLGVAMQQVPSLFRIIVIEGKVNAFIHCFVAVRRIITLHDLDVAICKNEGVEQYEELELGPLVRHPLVMHYFSVSPNTKDILDITSEEIISCLCEFIDIHKDSQIGIDDFLDFAAKQKSVSGREKLNVRIQGFGMHVTFIRQAKRLENSTLERCLKDVGIKKRPLLSSKESQLDEHSSFISKHIQSCSTLNTDFGGTGTHIRFVSPSLEKINTEVLGEEVNEEDKDFDSPSISLSQNPGSFNQPSCSYPSAAEERSRLDVRKADGEIDPSPANEILDYKESGGVLKRKRKPENKSGNVTVRRKLPKTVRDNSSIAIKSKREFAGMDDPDFSLDENSTRMFIMLWKKACRTNSVSEVFWRMLQFYQINQRKEKAKDWFLSHPFIGLLNVAVISITRGMWDCTCNDFQDFAHHGVADVLSEKHNLHESVEAKPPKKEAEGKTKNYIKDVTVDDIVQKVSTYFELDYKTLSNVESTFELKLCFLRKLCKCEFWLAKQFSVKKFRSLGCGEFLRFLEKHVGLLYDAMRKCLTVKTIKKSPLEVCMLEQQLVVLLSQAANSLGKDKNITKEMISPLLSRQFPLVSFVLAEKGVSKDFMDDVKKKGSISTCVLFSATLLAKHKEDKIREKNPSGTSVGGTNIGYEAKTFGSFTTKDAIRVLLKAPMLSDLISWTHWDIVFAPSLGPLVRWLLNEVKVKMLMCLVTKDGKVIRIDRTASVELFSEACIKGSSFQTAVQLLSVLSLYGGEAHVPLSLLKRHARQGFEVVMKNCGKIEMNESNCTVRKKAKVASRFFIDCLGHLPGEFHVFAADILLSGLKIVLKDAPSVILRKCKQIDQRHLLHDVGLSLGIVEWIDDYHLFASSMTNDSMISSGKSCLGVVAPDTNSEISHHGSYLQKLLELSAAALPKQTAKKVFEVFLQWSDALKSGSLNSCDLIYLQECLQKLEFTVLPTSLDKWVSLHPSFGFVCWCDDKSLKREFMCVDNVAFLYFGELSVDEQELLRSKVSVVMQALGIPSLSEVITREAIYYGLADSSLKISLLNWAFPFAQRYIYNAHREKYLEIQQSGFEFLSQLRIIIVDKLFSRNIIKGFNIASRKRRVCKCLLKGYVLYATQESDSHSLFMELSSLLIGVPNLHLANFLHMITTMAESGSNEKQIERFILYSQKIPKLPDSEPVWSLPSSSLMENDETLQTNHESANLIDQTPTNPKRPVITKSWPPVDWKTAPGFNFSHSNGMNMQSAKGVNGIRTAKRTDHRVPTEIDAGCNGSATEECDPTSITAMLVLPDFHGLKDQNDVVGLVDPDSESDGLNSRSFLPSGVDNLSCMIPNAQTSITGRLGEHVAYNYFSAHAGKSIVTWVNQILESGLPYDLVIEDEQKSLEYIEVKATKFSNKGWFHLSLREWLFAVEQGEHFTIAHVILSGNDVARITMFKNPAKLCQLGKLQLAVLMPKLLEEFSTT